MKKFLIFVAIAIAVTTVFGATDGSEMDMDLVKRQQLGSGPCHPSVCGPRRRPRPTRPRVQLGSGPCHPSVCG
ncbi:unnamed protein product [Allacma fusca]|uniref:Uncharacterized protein n=1 Tax=Allacma fusca TaxID=39272 RepID=A0A8J2KVN3_9HEXA|nr:unnamed protein product [Allacma fusca]